MLLRKALPENEPAMKKTVHRELRPDLAIMWLSLVVGNARSSPANM